MTNTLLCPFLDGSDDYARGVEFGLLWSRLRDTSSSVIEDYFTRANQDQILLACGRAGWHAVEMKPWDANWMWFRLERIDGQD
jgi:hypothetical protein